MNRVAASRLVILGRDGILNRFRDDHVKSVEEWETLPGAFEAIGRLNQAGWHVVVATNQSGIGRGMIEIANLNAVHRHLMREAQAQGCRIDAIFFCPHTPEEACACRKPAPGMMRDIAARYGVPLAQVPMVGDTLRDLLAAKAAGCQPHLVLTGRAQPMDPTRRAQWLAQVPETRIHADLAAFADWVLAHDTTAAPAPATDGAAVRRRSGDKAVAGRSPRSERSDRSDRPEKAEAADKPAKVDKAEKADRAEKADKADKADRTDRAERSARAERTERAAAEAPARVGGRESPRR